MTIIRRVCQFCGKDMGTKDGHGLTGVSHGTCKDCNALPEPDRFAIYRARITREKAMTHSDLMNIVMKVHLPDGWRVRVMGKGDGFLMQIVFVAKDTDTGEGAEQRCRKWYVSSHSTVTEVVRTLYKAGVAALEHEFAETFTYKGVAVFHPHRDVEDMAGLTETGAEFTGFDRRQGEKA